MERRARLAQLMARLDIDGQLDKLLRAHEEEDVATKEEIDNEKLEYPFLTVGPRELREAIIEIAKFSIKRTAIRIQRAKRQRDDPDEDVDAETKSIWSYYTMGDALSYKQDWYVEGSQRTCY